MSVCVTGVEQMPQELAAWRLDLAGGEVLRRGGSGSGATVRQVQRGLRALGYLTAGIDGDFGLATELAVKGVQHDLLHNEGHGRDGPAPVGVVDFNRGRVAGVTGAVDRGLADCLEEMMASAAWVKLPRAEDAAGENERARQALRGLRPVRVPTPFLVGVCRQESQLQHFNEPVGEDEDTYVRVGFDRKKGEGHVVTSRGYGIGQYTLFHHPPTEDKVRDFMIDPVGNVNKAIDELEDKFLHYVIGRTSGTTAEDRVAEHGGGPLRYCRISDRTDPLWMNDCANCLGQLPTCTVRVGETPLYKGCPRLYTKTRYYKRAAYEEAPVRESIPCDWPYAVRRYNGSGVNSYHYQTIVLLNVKAGS
ncbi:MAG: peptidoglycan-binding domain-containing protein [Candidatus Hydrogenedentes bacterium]|nr:peptidoglycan-binding domain-containing protein [Candidatus Hydrogenedentota bacterium]